MKKRQVALYIVVMLILFTTSVYAAVSAELSFNITGNSDNKAYAGDEFTIGIGLKDIEAQGGIKSIEGYIDINDTVLEKLTVDSIVTESDGKVHIDENNILSVYDASKISSDTGIILNTDPVTKKGDYKIVINLASPITKATELVTLKFKIKDNIAAGGYESIMSYKLFTVFSEDATEKKELGTRSFRIDISEGKRPSSGNDTNTPTNKPTNKPTNNPSNVPTNKPENKPTNKPTNNPDKPTNRPTQQPTDKPANRPPSGGGGTAGGGSSGGGSTSKPGVQGQTTKPDATVSPTNLPRTGVKIVLIPIVIIGVVGYVFYKKYSKYNYHE